MVDNRFLPVKNYTFNKTQLLKGSHHSKLKGKTRGKPLMLQWFSNPLRNW